MPVTIVYVASMSSLFSQRRPNTCASEIQPFPPFPPELLLKILRYLPQTDLRAASMASQEFYHLALAAGLYIRRTVRWYPSNPMHGFGASLAKIDAVVAYAKNTRPALNIAIRASFTIGQPAQISTAAGRFFASLTHALEHLVRLDLVFSESTSDSVYTHLCAHPAPKLSYFAVEHEKEGSATVPQDLFNRHAPNLRALKLKLGTTESLRAWASVPVLQRITHLHVSADQTPHPIVLIRLFPELRSLSLGRLTPQHPPERKIDLSGLRLEYIALAQSTKTLTNPSGLEAIPVVEIHGKLTDAVWPAQWQRDSICARAEERSMFNVTISIGAADGAWRRSVALNDRPREAALPLADVPLLASRLVSITLAKSFVNAFIRAPARLVALRELFLDVSAPDCRHPYCWPPIHPRDLGTYVHFDELPPQYVRVRCPALARVVIFALPSGHPVTVRPTKVTALGRVLRLREPGLTPTLTLAGCTFHEPPTLPEINQLFSRIDFVECSTDVMPGYYHTCCYSGVFTGDRWY